jgi:hypothetical protein
MVSRRDSKRKGIGEKKKEIIKGSGREVYPRYEVRKTRVAKA